MAKQARLDVWSATALCFLAVALPARAQDLPKVEIEVAFGAVVYPGENSKPSPSTVSAGFAVWPSNSWGIAVSQVFGIGASLFNPVAEAPDRLFIGEQGLRYMRIAVRYRRELADRVWLQFGGGVIVGGSRQSVQLFKTPTGFVRSTPRDSWGSIIAWEASIGARFNRHLAGRVGLTVDGEPESFVIQPTLIASISF
jgi:hypothetical protein